MWYLWVRNEFNPMLCSCELPRSTQPLILEKDHANLNIKVSSGNTYFLLMGKKEAPQSMELDVTEEEKT